MLIQATPESKKNFSGRFGELLQFDYLLAFSINHQSWHQSRCYCLFLLHFRCSANDTIQKMTSSGLPRAQRPQDWPPVPTRAVHRQTLCPALCYQTARMSLHEQSINKHSVLLWATSSPCAMHCASNIRFHPAKMSSIFDILILSSHQIWLWYYLDM